MPFDVKNLDWKTLFFTFEGRASRKLFWVQIGLGIAINILINVIAMVLGAGIGNLLGLLAFVPLVWAAVAVGVKRLHDLDQSGWLFLLILVPLVNLGMLVWLGAFAGTPGPNRFGDLVQTI